MSRGSRGGGLAHEGGRRLRQLVAGLVALPLSVLPFAAYLTMTPEGRLVRDKVEVFLAPPTLPELTPAESTAARTRAPRYEGGVMVLGYHGVGSTTSDGGEGAGDGEASLTLSSERFAEHLATLRAAGMSVVTAAEAADAFAGRRPLPPDAVMITFDDGRTDAMAFADPLLEEAEMSATMFVITGAASQSGIYYAGWDEIDEYARSGRWDIQSHTEGSHRKQPVAGGGTLPALTSLAPGEDIEAYRSRIRADLAGASDAIQQRLGRPPVALAYPFGAHGADRSNHPAIEGVLREEVARHYDLAFHQDRQEDVPLAACDQDALGLRRLSVGDWPGARLLDEIAAAASTSPAGCGATMGP